MQATDTGSPIVKLANLMCAESCVMTALNLRGYNHNYLMLESWSLVYEAKTLLAGKRLDKFDLDFLYGIKTRESRGGLAEVKALLEDSCILLISVYTAKLSFFPQYQITLPGFSHQIVVHGYDERTDEFEVIDPIVDFMGRMRPQELWEASISAGEFQLWSMHFPAVPKSLALDEIFRRAAAINFIRFPKNRKALEFMREDLMMLPQFPERERISWVDQNNLAVTTLLQVRQTVWQYTASLGLLSPAQIENGRRLFDVIARQWTAVNFQLMKYKNAPHRIELLEQINERFEKVQQTEHEFLDFLFRITRELTPGPDFSQ